MANKEVLRMGDARLLRIAEPVTAFDTAELHALLADMRDTMHAMSGVGLAAPQIGVNLRVVIFEVAGNPRYPEAEAVPQTVLINPVITLMKKKMEEDWEGCLSVPGLRGIVPRYTHIRYRGYDEYGAVIDRTVTVSDAHERPGHAGIYRCAVPGPGYW
jgi:peptide deformylase